VTLPIDELDLGQDRPGPSAAGTPRRLVVEADGGSRGNPGPAAYGALVQDAVTGELLNENAEYLGETTNNVAEYSGLVSGLRMAKEIDPTAQVAVRMDSKLVVEQMSGRWKIKHEDMRRLALQARAILPRSQVTYQWIPRAENSAADRLANEAMDLAAKGRTWQRRAVPSEPSGSVPYAGDVSDPTIDARPDADSDAGPDLEPPARLTYRLLSGPDDAAFCERVSAALADGYQLHGGPAITHDGTRIVVAQALVDPRMLGFGS
jgi:ribonuclease HI